MATEHKELINKAEGLRLGGKPDKALQILQPLINPADISDLSDETLSDYIRMWRIYAVSGINLAQRKWFANSAEDILVNIVRPIFTKYYFHKEVEHRFEQKSQQYLNDNEGRPYDSRAEMLRDVGKYWLIAFYVFGDPEFLNQSIIDFGRAVEAATLDSPKGIANVELGQVKRLQRDLSGKSKGSIYDTYVHRGYKLAITEVLQSDDGDRLKWLLTNVEYEAILNKNRAEFAQEDIRHVQEVIKINFDEDEYAKIKRDFVREGRLLEVHRIVWGSSGFRTNPSKLMLY